MKRPTLVLCAFLVLCAGMLSGYLLGRWKHRPQWRASQMPSALPSLHRFPSPTQDPPSPEVSTVEDDVRAWTHRALVLKEATSDVPSGLKRITWQKLAGPGKVTFTPPDALETRASFDSPGDYLLRVSGHPEGDAPPVSKDIAARVQHAPLDLWKQKRFSATAASDPLVSGDQADPDRDGISNLVEYALMLDPQKSDVGGLPDPGVRKGRVHLTYRRPASAVDVVYHVQWTDDMKTWHDEAVDQQIIVSVGDLQVIQASAPAPADRPGRFMRLRITGP